MQVRFMWSVWDNEGTPLPPPISNLTNRLSTSRERQKGFIPESTGRTDRLHKCSLREQHGEGCHHQQGSHRRRLPWNIHSKLRSRRRHLDVNHDGGQALISYSWLSITDRWKEPWFFFSPPPQPPLIVDYRSPLMAVQNEYETIVFS